MKETKTKLHKLAFTLIELLVVIAIIGILSGLIVVAMGGVTQKANFAKTQVFSNSLRNSLMLNIVGEWKFDEGSGGTATNSWGSGNTGTLKDIGGACSATLCPQWQTTGCISGNCLSFNGAGAYIEIPNNASLNFGTDDFTIELWTYRTAAGIQGGSYFANNDYALSYAGFNIYDGVFHVRSNGGDFAVVSMSPASNIWENHVFVINQKTSPYVKHYINGVLNNAGYSETPANFGSVTSAYPTTIGYSRAGGLARYFNGLIDNVRFYNAAMPASRIRENYYIGLNNLLVSGGIEKEKYSLRFNEMAQN